MKINTAKERENAFYTLYGVKGQKDVLEQFKARVTALKAVPFENNRMSKENVEKENKARYKEEYIQLLELILEYSHAMFFLYSKDRINKNFSAYSKVANQLLRAENVKKAFSKFKRLHNYIEPKEESETEESVMIIDSSCLALEHIDTLKKELEKDDIKIMGGSVDSRKAYIKFAIVSLATGANSKDILDVNYDISPKKSIVDFEYINTLVSELRAYQAERKLSERGIRNGIDKLKLSMSNGLHEKVRKKYSHCRSFNHLIYLHKEAYTSSTPKIQK